MNLLTNVQERMTKMLNATDQRLKGFSTLPYGVKKLTPAEQRKRFENLTPDEVARMLEEYGPEEVNNFLNRFMED